MSTTSWRKIATAALTVLLVGGGMAVYAGSSVAQTQPAAAPAGPLTGTVTLLTPSRIADSRVGSSFGTFHAVERQDLQIVGRGGVPLTGVSGAVLNVTVVDPQVSGYLTVWPVTEPQPNVSNVNFQAGQNIANTVIVRLPVTDGTVSLFNGSFGDIDVLVDVEGYISG